MKATITSLFLLFGILFQVHVFGQQTCDIELEITGIRSNSGQLMVSVHLGPKGFPHKNMYKQLFITDYTFPTYTVVLKDIPYGNSAISILHDENKSGKMDFNIFHFPKEGYGFYKDYNVTISPPNYEDVEFEISQKEMHVETKMQY